MKARVSARDAAVWLLGLAGLGFSIFATSAGFHNSLFDFHGFRQAQTAIAAESILRGGSFFHYETPVLGPPWSLPFEFPLYQGLVASVARVASTPLDQTGRAVSILFYYLCFFPLASILSSIGFKGAKMIPVLALFAVSPLYVFVSRLFMIESTALFLSLMYADQIFRLVLRPGGSSVRYIAGAAICGVLAGLVKVTTFAPFFVLGAFVLAWDLRRQQQRGDLRQKTAASAAAFCIALPFVATWGWTRFADRVKEQNPFGVYLTSHALRAWNFGPFRERLHPRIYLQLLYATDNQIGRVTVLFLVLAVYVLLCRRWDWVVPSCLALYAGTILLFFNLHVVHEYYAYSNAIFLVVAVGALVSRIISLPGKRAWAGVVLLGFCMAACGRRYFNHYYPLQRENAAGRPQVAELLDHTTSADAAVVILGLDWSPELPYQSDRRAIMDSSISSVPRPMLDAALEKAIDNEGRNKVAAVVACADGRSSPELPALLTELDMGRSLQVGDCEVYERAGI
jgi:hypothetical protein